eukprot:3233988-Prymnesium_polylepis.2
MRSTPASPRSFRRIRVSIFDSDSSSSFPCHHGQMATATIMSGSRGVMAASQSMESASVSAPEVEAAV